MPDEHQDQAVAKNGVETGQTVPASLAHRQAIAEHGIPGHAETDRLVLLHREFLGDPKIRQPQSAVQSEDQGRFWRTKCNPSANESQ